MKKVSEIPKNLKRKFEEKLNVKGTGLPRNWTVGNDGTRVAQVSTPADLSGLGGRERDCLSGARARPEGPSERE